MSNPIVTFLEGRKQKPLKEGKKPAADIESDYSTLVWVANAAQRASQLSLVSHPAKFSHPDAKGVTSILYNGSYKNDGYLRSGNVIAEHVDVTGNAAALDVYAFLSLVLDDGKLILQHLEEQTPHIKDLLGADDETFQSWRKLFLQIKPSAGNSKTHPNVKQVYFPVDGGYHLLSILTPSRLITENRKRLKRMKAYAPETKEARHAKKHKLFHAEGFSEVVGILTQHFGGSNKQNISQLNSSNNGEAWLLPCFPPELDNRYIRLPKTDFFKTLYSKDKDLQELLAGLHKLFAIEHYTNVAMRERRKRLMAQVFEWVLERAMRLQLQPAAWSTVQGFDLPLAQQLWLDAAFSDQRAANPTWQEDIAEAVIAWFVPTYNRSRTQDDAVTLGTTEVNAFQNELVAYFRQHKDYIQ